MNPQFQPIEPASLPRPVDPSLNSVQPSQPVAPAVQSSSQVNAIQIPGGAKISTHSPDIAEDVDLIEKEWVDKAKHIVSKTKEDPREQNVEIAKLKADYMKKRYNKDVRVDTE
jgi:hypothetical protein